MIQLFCPACENVVWVEEVDAEEPVFCPECSQAIHASSNRASNWRNALGSESCQVLTAPLPSNGM